MVDLLKCLGGDIVVPQHYALTWRFPELVGDLPKPALAINFVKVVAK